MDESLGSYTVVGKRYVLILLLHFFGAGMLDLWCVASPRQTGIGWGVITEQIKSIRKVNNKR